MRSIFVTLLFVIAVSAWGTNYDHEASKIDKLYAGWWITFENCITVDKHLEGDYLSLCVEQMMDKYAHPDMTIYTGHNSRHEIGRGEVEVYINYLIGNFIEQEYHTGPGGPAICFKNRNLAMTIKNSDVLTYNTFFSNETVTTFINERKIFYWQKYRGEWKIRGLVTDPGWKYSVGEQDQMDDHVEVFSILGTQDENGEWIAFGVETCSYPEFDDIVLADPSEYQNQRRVADEQETYRPL